MECKNEQQGTTNNSHFRTKLFSARSGKANWNFSKTDMGTRKPKKVKLF